MIANASFSPVWARITEIQRHRGGTILAVPPSALNGFSPTAITLKIKGTKGHFEKRLAKLRSTNTKCDRTIFYTSRPQPDTLQMFMDYTIPISQPRPLAILAGADGYENLENGRLGTTVLQTLNATRAELNLALLQTIRKNSGLG